MTMKKVNIFEAKAHLSEYVEAVLNGEEVVICRRNRPVAELRAVAAARTSPRPVGGAKRLVIPASFFDPLPDEIVDAFDDGGPPYELSSARASRAVEGRGRARPIVRRGRGRAKRR
jgi:prevent-host-death family protein